MSVQLFSSSTLDRCSAQTATNDDNRHSDPTTSHSATVLRGRDMARKIDTATRPGPRERQWRSSRTKCDVCKRTSRTSDRTRRYVYDEQTLITVRALRVLPRFVRRNEKRRTHGYGNAIYQNWRRIDRFR